jgi:hypothetical protein
MALAGVRFEGEIFHLGFWVSLGGGDYENGAWTLVYCINGCRFWHEIVHINAFIPQAPTLWIQPWEIIELFKLLRQLR